MAKAKKWIWDILLWIGGGAVFSVSVNMFSAPGGIVLGGLTGTATLINHLFPVIPIGLAIFLMNIPLFILAKIFLHQGFLLRTFIATVIFTSSIDIGAAFIPAYEGDTLLGALFCGVLSGTGLALVLLTGATTGGTEIMATLIRLRYPRVSMGRVMLVIDAAIVAASFFVYGEIENAMYGAVIIFLSSRTLDTVLYGSGYGKVIFTVTEVPDKLAEAIMQEVSRGVTLFPAVGAYTKKNKTMLMCAVKKRQISTVIRFIKETDPKAFTLVCDTGEIIGEGFN